MFTHGTTELDALILVGADPASAERCLAALVAVSLDVPLRTWVIEVRTDQDGREALQDRCVWTRGVEGTGPVAARVERALSQGRSPLVLVLDGSHAITANTVRALVEVLRRDLDLAAVGLGALPRCGDLVRPGSVGPALLVRRAALERFGALIEGDQFAGAQAEAEAWCRRAERAGALVQLSPAKPRIVERAAQPMPRLELSRRGAPVAGERRTFRAAFTPQAPAGPLELARTAARHPNAADALGQALVARFNRALQR